MAIKMTAKAKLDALVEWCKRKICNDVKACWKVHFTNHYAYYTLELELAHHDSIDPDAPQVGEVFASAQASN